LSERKIVLDIETCDPNLGELGDGSIRKDGHILMCCTYDGQEHRTCRPETPSWDYLKEVCADASITKIAHNGIYDYNWIQNGYNIPINGKMEDTMTRQGLINEYAGHYDLDSCCLREGVAGKSGDIQAYWKQMGGTGDVRANLPLIPLDIIEGYCQQDARATWDLFHAQQPKLEKHALLGINDIECKQYPIILMMKKNGLRVDVPKLEEATIQQQQLYDEKFTELQAKYGVTSLTKRKGPGSILDVLVQLGLGDQLTSTKTGLSMSADSLKGITHEIGDYIRELRSIETMLTKYLTGALVKNRVGERLHGTLKPTQRDDGGTITGRYSCQNPNLENFTSYENKGGALIKSLFIPDDDCYLGSFDYKQIEYVVFGHYAVGPGSTQLRENMHKGIDYHQLVQDMLRWTFTDARGLVKTFNFGVAYGRGLNSIIEAFGSKVVEQAAGMGMTPAQYLTHFWGEYFRKASFVRPTQMAIRALSEQNGGMRSIGGRWHHLPPDGKNYKMVAYMCQGGAADIIKMAMAKSWDAGVFNVLHPHVPVHDEVIFSAPKTKEGVEACKELQYCMENCAQLKVPIRVGAGLGHNWWEAKKSALTISQFEKEII